MPKGAAHEAKTLRRWRGVTFARLTQSTGLENIQNVQPYAKRAHEVGRDTKAQQTLRTENKLYTPKLEESPKRAASTHGVTGLKLAYRSMVYVTLESPYHRWRSYINKRHRENHIT